MLLKNPEIRIETTAACNTHCEMCPREQLTRSTKRMPMRHFKDLINQSKSLGADTISLFGFGEPLLDKTLPEKINYCSSNGLKTFITTNASLLTTDIAYSLLNAGLTHMRISAHGVFENYEEMHHLCFAKFIRNTFNFWQIKKLYDCKLDIVAMDFNEDIERIKKFWVGKCDDLEIWEPHNWAYGENFRSSTKKKKSCGRPFNGPVQITCDGKMVVCCFDFNSKMVVGDTYKNTIEEILKGDDFNQIRRKHETGNLEGLICNNCDQLNDFQSLVYSTRDPELKVGTTSSCKIKLEEKWEE